MTDYLCHPPTLADPARSNPGQSVLALGLVILITLIWRIWLPQSLLGPLAYLLLILPLLGLLRNVIIWTSRQYIVTDRREIQISIHDNGPGLPRKNRPRYSSRSFALIKLSLKAMA